MCRSAIEEIPDWNETLKRHIPKLWGQSSNCRKVCTLPDEAKAETVTNLIRGGIMKQQLTVTKGEFEGLTAIGKDEASAHRNLKAKIKRIRDKKHAFTKDDMSVLADLFFTQIIGLDEAEILEDINAGEYFSLRSYEHAEELWQKIRYLKFTIEDKEGN